MGDFSFDKNVENVVVIGSGPAGLTSAIYLGRAQKFPLVITGTNYGGQLMGTYIVENFPGFEEGVMGPELMRKMEEQAKKFGARIFIGSVSRVDFSKKIKKVFVGEKEILSKSVIIATGASPKRLGVEGEEEFWGKGISVCATCDGALFKDKVVCVIGGGDAAMEESDFLTRFAKKVYLIHRRDSFRANPIGVERVLRNEKIEVLYNSEVKKFIGEKRLEKVLVFNNLEGREREIEVEGAFLAVGHIPNSGIFKGKIDLLESGFIKVFDQVKTSVEGVFACGDVCNEKFRQAIVACGSGAIAAIECEKYLSENF